MTSEEAIRRIKDHMKIHGIYKSSNPETHPLLAEALELAIESLEQCEPTAHWVCRTVDRRFQCSRCGHTILHIIHKRDGLQKNCPGCHSLMTHVIKEEDDSPKQVINMIKNGQLPPLNNTGRGLKHSE